MKIELTSLVFEKQKIDPADSLYFFGLTTRGTLEEIEEFKKEALAKTKLQVIFQHIDPFYLVILRASEPEAQKILAKKKESSEK